MKKLTTQNSVFGPYEAIEVLEDRYRCDGAELPFSVVGEGAISDAVAGDFPEPPAPPAPVPEAVTMRQARLALLGAGLLPGVSAAIAALPSPQKEAAQIEWEYSQTVERNRGFVPLLGAALGLTDAQLDGLFVAAAGL